MCKELARNTGWTEAQVRAPKFYKPKFYTSYLCAYLHERVTFAHHSFTIARALGMNLARTHGWHGTCTRTAWHDPCMEKES